MQKLEKQLKKCESIMQDIRKAITSKDYVNAEIQEFNLELEMVDLKQLIQSKN